MPRTPYENNFVYFSLMRTQALKLPYALFVATKEPSHTLVSYALLLVSLNLAHLYLA
jgi:hypothetical protein